MSEIYLRKAEYTDLDLLFQWVNDSDVRNYSFNSGMVKYDEHVRWFNSMMVDINSIQMILMRGDIPVGQIRLHLSGEDAEINYSIASEFRGRGYGKTILELVKQVVSDHYPTVKRLIAKVKPENISSNRLFRSAGYEELFCFYALDIK